MRLLVRWCFLFFLAISLVALPPGVTAEGPDQDIRLVVETPGYTLDDQGLHVPGYALSNIGGAPQLPVWTTVVEVPPGAEWAIEEVGSEEQVLLSTVVLPPAPATELRLNRPFSSFDPDSIADALAVDRRPDPAIYEANRLYPSQVVAAGPEGIANGKRLLPLKVYPFQYNPVTGELRYRPRIGLAIHFEARPTRTAEPVVAASPSPAEAAGPGLRIRTTERGMYRLTYGALSEAGVPVGSLNPAHLAIWSLGEPVDIEVSDGQDGKLDPGDEIVFYAEPYLGRYMTQNVYRLTWLAAPGARMTTREATPALAQPPITTVQRRARVENDRVYYSTYPDLAPDADHFFDNPLYALSGSAPAVAVTYTLSLSNVAADGMALVRVAAHGGLSVPDYNPDQSLALRLNGATLASYGWDGSVTHLIEQMVPASNLVVGGNKLALIAGLDQLPGLDKYWILPDWAEILYPSQTVAEGNHLYVESTSPISASRAGSRKLYLPLLSRDAATGTSDIAVSGFRAGNIRVYDVSDPRHPVRLTSVKETNDAGAYRVLFARPADRSFYLSTPDGVLAPVALEADPGSSWRSPGNEADYIAVVHRSLWDAVQPLLDYRSGEGLRVAKVDIQDIYDEFSDGRVDPEALRAFLTYAYHNWNTGRSRPQYVLLVGDGHFDFKGALRPDLPNLIPPYLLPVDPFIGETAADNRYVCVDGESDFLPDMAVGRIPARTATEVTAVVDKILAYEKSAPSGEWQKRAVFVADTASDAAGNFHALTDESRKRVPAPFNTATIYYKSLDSLDTAAEMKAAIQGAMNGDAIYLQWFGHAARTFLGKDKIWELSDPPKLAQNNVWPLTATFSCWAGYFVNIQASGQYGNSEQVVAEAMLLAPGKGSIADFSPTGLHLGSDLAGLNKGLVDAIFTNRTDRVGLAVTQAKLAYFSTGSGALDVIDTQVLLGDPALRLRLP